MDQLILSTLTMICQVYNYVKEDDIDKMLICPVCREPFIEPVVHTKCGNEFCKSCLSKVSKCPLCKDPLTTDNVQPLIGRSFLNLLKELLVVCPMCDGQIQRGDYKTHVSGCATRTLISQNCYLIISACSLGCGQRVTKNATKEHELVCTMRKTKCSAASVMCPWEGPHKDLGNHAQNCPYKQLQPVLSKLMGDVDTLRKELTQVTQSIQNLKLKQEEGNNNNISSPPRTNPPAFAFEQPSFTFTFGTKNV